MELYQHQKVIQEKLLQNKRYGLFWQMGTGKTKAILEALKCINKGAIIIGTKPAKVTWDEENIDYNIPFTFYNYSSFQKLKTEGIKNKVLVFDEAHHLKSINSQRSERALKLTPFPDKIYLLTGTPCADKPLDLFMLLVLLGKRDLKDFYRFRNFYCKMSKEKIYIKGGKGKTRIVNKVIGFKNLEIMGKELDKVASYLRLEECFDIPPVTFIFKNFFCNWKGMG